jgi:transcription termination factor Rho
MGNGGVMRRPLNRPPESMNMNRMNMYEGQTENRNTVETQVPTEPIVGMLDLRPDGSGILKDDYRYPDKEAYVSAMQIRRSNLRPGDLVAGAGRRPKESEKYWGLIKIETINGVPEGELGKRRDFMR